MRLMTRRPAAWDVDDYIEHAVNVVASGNAHGGKGGGGVEYCDRASDGARIHWDYKRSSMVIAHFDTDTGNWIIDTMFRPDNDHADWLTECAR